MEKSEQAVSVALLSAQSWQASESGACSLHPFPARGSGKGKGKSKDRGSGKGHGKSKDRGIDRGSGKGHGKSKDRGIATGLSSSGTEADAGSLLGNLGQGCSKHLQKTVLKVPR